MKSLRRSLLLGAEPSGRRGSKGHQMQHSGVTCAGNHGEGNGYERLPAPAFFSFLRSSFLFLPRVTFHSFSLFFFVFFPFHLACLLPLLFPPCCARPPLPLLLLLPPSMLNRVRLNPPLSSDSSEVIWSSALSSTLPAEIRARNSSYLVEGGLVPQY